MIGGIVTLIIALIGLLGYTSDETNRRGREIAIRKVNGGDSMEYLEDDFERHFLYCDSRYRDRYD